MSNIFHYILYASFVFFLTAMIYLNWVYMVKPKQVIGKSTSRLRKSALVAAAMSLLGVLVGEFGVPLQSATVNQLEREVRSNAESVSRVKRGMDDIAYRQDSLSIDVSSYGATVSRLERGMLDSLKSLANRQNQILSNVDAHRLIIDQLEQDIGDTLKFLAHGQNQLTSDVRFFYLYESLTSLRARATAVGFRPEVASLVNDTARLEEIRTSIEKIILQLADELGTEQIIVKTYVPKVIRAYSVGQYDSAIRLIDYLLRANVSSDLVAYACLYGGIIMQKTGQYDAALIYYRTASISYKIRRNSQSVGEINAMPPHNR